MVRYFLFGVSVLSFGSAQACRWCSESDPLPVLETLKDDARFTLKRSALLSGLSVEGSIAIAPLSLQHPLTHQEPPHNNRFYTEYLLSYFPKEAVITEQLFPTMCPDAVRKALYALAYLITNAPWRYFANNEDDFKFELVHIQILDKQLFSIAARVTALLVDPKTNHVCAASDVRHSFAKRQPTRNKKLIDMWRSARSLDEYYLFVALGFDVVIHQIYSALKHEEYKEAYSLQRYLSGAVKRLVGSRYEQQYTQAVRLCGELVKMLQQRVWSATEEDDIAVSVPPLQPLVSHINKKGPSSHATDFLKSFITHYEANVTGKFTHEYHPMLLDETAHSFAQLEQKLESESLPIVGRYTLMGYEEQGITRYKTKYTDALFSDEMTHKTNAGWSLKMFNRFGLLTGFLCKDVAAFNATVHGSIPVTHINADQVEIFDGLGTLFQEHAFGDAYKPTLMAYQRAKNCLLRGDMAAFFGECMKFWHILYSRELKVTGRQHVVGTQDILFSIAYTKYLQQSTVPLLHFYLGPDITYPIETSLLHNKEATKHAQTFVRTFTPQLKPINNKKTAYVFCSFVDGVGKSTMLGNVQNMMKHGMRIDEYEHVDNSSSQLATVFSYSDDVVIADLPAQVSHFTYKPDGYVYVDCGALCDAHTVSQLHAYVATNAPQLDDSFSKLLVHAATQPYDLDVFERINPELSYAATVCLLKKQNTNHWVSFVYNDEYYLFDRDNKQSIRKRVPLATAPSHGLKNCCPEQMIFSIGVRFPMNYEYFLQDLMKQLHEKQVAQVVMVDFVSMYSRSSRENIRVNYIVQQLALLEKQFSVAHSFYQDFVHNAQLLADLDDPQLRAQFAGTLKQESLVRLALFDLLLEHGDTTIDGIGLAPLTEQLRVRMQQYDPEVYAQLQQLVADKITNEYAGLKRGYGLSREYIALQQFNTSDLLSWSAALTQLMTRSVVNEEVNELWSVFSRASSVRGVMSTQVNPDEEATKVFLDSGVMVEVLGFVPARCRDRQRLLTLIRMARARWHAALSNLLYTQVVGGELHMQQRLPVIPLAVLPDEKGNLCFVQPILAEVSFDERVETSYELFEVSYSPEKPEQWRAHGDRLYLHNWSDVASSHGGVFAYGHELSTEPIETQGKRGAIVSNLYTQYARALGADKVLVPEKLYQMLVQEKQEILQANKDIWKEAAEENKCMPEKEVALPLKKEKKSSYGSRMKKETVVFAMSEQQKKGIRLYLRAVATLDMLIKDIDGDFALRRFNKNDFIAHIKLTEEITLPWLFGLYSQEPLFESYEEIQPLVAV